MNKLKKVWIVFIIMAIPFVLGLILGQKVNLPGGEDVIISRKEYQSLTNGKNNKFPEMEKLEKLIDDYYLFDVDQKKVEENVYKGLFQGLNDPYSVYMNQEEYQGLMESTSGKYAGVGIVVSVSEDNFITVVSPIEGTPAFEAGIRTGDKIIQVNEETFSGHQMEEATEKMRGEPNTDVSITLSRPVEGKVDEVFDVNLTRRMIQMHTVKSKVLKEGIGYLHINQFDENTTNEFNTEYNKLKEANVKGIVLDLRNNPGGLLPVTVQIADILLPKGVIVKTVDKNGNEEVENSSASMEDIPMTVLVNGGSASASEILAGALKDYGRATLVGTQTFGKGIVQRVFPLSENMETGPGVKLTVSEYFTPKGTRIHEVGVTPDIVSELSKEVKATGPDNIMEDTQLQDAIENIKSRVK